MLHKHLIPAIEVTVTDPTTITDSEVMVCISLGTGLLGDKKFTTEEELHLLLLRMLNELNPRMITVVVAGFLKRWNFWDMVETIEDDDTLVTLLKDLPNVGDEETIVKELAIRFQETALSLEQKYITNLKTYLDKFFNRKEEIKEIQNIKRPAIVGWSELKGYEDTPIPTDPKDLADRILITKNNYLKKKKERINATFNRMIKANSIFASLQLEKLIDGACYFFTLEELKFFLHLSEKALIYPGKPTPALEIMFFNKKNKLHWHEVSFNRPNPQPPAKAKKVFPRIPTPSSTSYLHQELLIPPPSTLAERKLSIDTVLTPNSQNALETFKFVLEKKGLSCYVRITDTTNTLIEETPVTHPSALSRR